MLKKILKQIVRIIHVFLVLFYFVGAFIAKKYLILFIFAWPLLFLHWQTNNNKCICTQIEAWLDNQEDCLNQYEDFPFITRMLNFLNIEIKGKKTKYYIFCTSLTFFWLIGMYRYYN